MKIFLEIIQVVSALSVIISIILQSGGSQLGMAFGGQGQGYRSKRGLEKTLFYIIIGGVSVFAFVSILIVATK